MCISIDLVKIGLLYILKYTQCLLNTGFCKWGMMEYCRNGRGGGGDIHPQAGFEPGTFGVPLLEFEAAP